MDRYWLISYIALWTVTIVLGVVVLVHSRLIGLLHHRLAPSAAKPLVDGPEIASKMSPLSGVTPEGNQNTIEFPAHDPVLLLFISPLCELCNTLAPHAIDFGAAHRDVRLVLVSTLGDLGMNRAFIAYRRLDSLSYLVAPELADQLSISGTPYAVFVSSQGTVLRKGLVNHYEHLRSLVTLNQAPSELEIQFEGGGENAEVSDHA